jgi:hypothetical protein
MKVTGIYRLISPFDRETTMEFLKQLGLQYSLREINKGIYTYCSITEAHNFGFCRSQSKCQDCAVIDICNRNL